MVALTEQWGWGTCVERSGRHLC